MKKRWDQLRWVLAVSALLLTLSTTPVWSQVTEGTVTVEGVELFYRDIGSGPPLVLLHGFSLTGDVAWEPYYESFGAAFRLIVPDLRGHGRSTNPTGVFTHRQAARDILALLDELAIGQFRAIGYSSGAITLLHMATEQPSRVQALILAAGAPYFTEESRNVVRAGCSEQVIADRTTWHGGDEGKIRSLCRQLQSMEANPADINFSPSLLSTISAPTLILYGDRDDAFPVELALEQYRAIPNSFLWVLPGVSHRVVFERFGAPPEVAAEFTRVALGFLRDHRPPM